MRFGRSALGVIVGILLGLGVVALVGSGLNPYGIQAAPVQPSSSQTNGASTLYVTTTNANGVPVTVPETGTTPSYAVGGAPLSQVSSIARQPVTLTGFVLLPIFAAFLFGFVLYRVSRVRSEEEEPPGTA